MYKYIIQYGTVPVAPVAQRYLVTLTRWDVSSIPVNGIFLAKKLKNKIKMPNEWRTIKSLGHKISTSQSTRERNG